MIQAEDFAAGVRAAGGQAELHLYEGAGHAFLNKPDSKPADTAACTCIVSSTLLQSGLSSSTVTLPLYDLAVNATAIAWCMIGKARAA